MWKQYLHIPKAHSFITPECLEPGCGAVSSPLEEREDSAEERCGVPAVSPTKHGGFLWGKMEPPTDTTYL